MANGQSDPRHGIIYLNHPEADSCYLAEFDATSTSQGRKAWQQCFAWQSTWIMDWIREVRQITINLPGCKLEQVPVSLNDYSDDWWF